MTKYLLFLLSLPLVAHANIDGNLNITQPMHIHITQETDCRDADPRPGCLGPFEFDLDPTNYSARIVDNGDSLHLTLSGGHQYADLDVQTGGQGLPDNGDFHYSAAQTGQEWGLSGNIQTIVNDTPEQQGYESCQYRRQEWVCDGHGHCRYETRWYWGQRLVRYYDHNVDTNLKFDVVASRPLGHFDGQQRISQRIYTYTGECY